MMQQAPLHTMLAPVTYSKSEVGRFFEAFSYKPDWVFEHRYEATELAVSINYFAPSSEPPHIKTRLQSHFRLAHDLIWRQRDTDWRRVLMQWLSQEIHKAEGHEKDEWLKLDGVRWNPPHPEQDKHPLALFN